MPKKFSVSGLGFTLIELMIIIATLGVLTVLTYSYAVPKYRERTSLTSANSELHSMGDAVTLYLSKYNDYPLDADRNIPSDLMQFIQNSNKPNWPAAPWSNSTYDYDNWDDWTDNSVQNPFLQCW
jgi:Tfp pilus assembly protein PilE